MENRRSFLTRAALGVVAAGASSAPAASDQFVVGFIGTGIACQICPDSAIQVQPGLPHCRALRRIQA